MWTRSASRLKKIWLNSSLPYLSLSLTSYLCLLLHFLVLIRSRSKILMCWNKCYSETFFLILIQIRKYQKFHLKDNCCKISNTILQTKEIKIQKLQMKSCCLGAYSSTELVKISNPRQCILRFKVLEVQLNIPKVLQLWIQIVALFLEEGISLTNSFEWPPSS